MADGPVDDSFGMYRDLLERARELCHLSIDVLNCLEWFRQYVSEGIENSGKLYGFNDSPQRLREAIYQLWMRCHERDVPAGRNVWVLLPVVQIANAGHLRTIKCGTSFVTTATETIFHWSEWVEGQSLRACLWIPSGSKLDSPAHDPSWGGRVQDVADLEPYHNVLRSIRKAISQWKITENNLRRLECWIEAEHVRTIRYLNDPPAPTEKSGWPTLTPAELRTLFDIEQDALKRRLESQCIPNEKITTKSYRVDPSALPDDWKRTLKRG